MRTLARAMLWTTLATGVAAVLLPVRAELPDKRAFTRLAPAGLDLPAALQAAAHTLFRPPRGTLFRIERTGQRSEPGLAAELDVYAVSSDEAGPVGTFTRFRCWPTPDSVVDLALRLEEGAIKAVAPVRPLVIAGAAYPTLPAALAGAPALPVHVWCPAVAALFRALADQEACLAGPADSEAPDAKAAAALLAELERVRPPLLPGAPLPDVSARDLDGKALSTATLPGKPVLVLAASVKHDLSRRAIEHLAQYAREHATRFEVLLVLADAPAAIRAFRERGGQLPGTVLPDPSRRLRDALHVSTLPTLFAFDDQSKLVGYRRAPWPAYDELAAQLDKVPATAPSPRPSPAEDAPKAKPKPKRKKVPEPEDEEPAVPATASPAASAPPARPTTASLPEIAPDALLAAWRALAPTAGTTVTTGTPTAQVRRTITRFAAGSALQRVDVVDEKDDVLETLVRVAVHPRVGTRIDLLVSPEAGGVRAYQPLAIAQVDGKDLPHLKELLAPTMHKALDTQGPALARVFAALSVAARPAPDADERDAAAMAGTGTGPGTTVRVVGASAAPSTPPMRLTLVSPGLAIGARMPKKALAGDGRAALVLVVGREDGALDAGVKAEIEKDAAGKKVRVVVLESEDEPVVAVPFVPYAYAVDAAGKVVGRGAVNGAASVRALVDGLSPSPLQSPRK